MKNRLFTLMLAVILAVSMVGCSDASAPVTASSDGTVSAIDGVTSSTDAANSTAASQAMAATSSSNSTAITEDKAKEVALSHAGLSEAEVTFIKVKLDRDDGRQVYEVEFYNGNTEYDYDIDALSGEIVGYDYDIESYTIPSGAQSGSSETYIGEDEAKSIALAKVAGATESDIQLRLDYDDGRTVYEGSIVYDKLEYEFEIDAVNGSVLSWEVESVYDD